MILKNYKMFALLCIMAIMLACAPAFAPSSAPALPTFDPNSINTAIVQTANAAVTQTALVVSPTATSTNTPLPTVTPSETPSPTVTFVFLLKTPTPIVLPLSTIKVGSSGLKFDCQIISKLPADGSHKGPNADFTMDWRVANIGTETWDSNSADYHYKSGDKIHKASIYDLPSSVSPGKQIDIKVVMKAPGSSGSYSTTWVINSGQTEFCKMSINIQVP